MRCDHAHSGRFLQQQGCGAMRWRKTKILPRHARQTSSRRTEFSRERRIRACSRDDAGPKGGIRARSFDHAVRLRSDTTSGNGWGEEFSIYTDGRSAMATDSGPLEAIEIVSNTPNPTRPSAEQLGEEGRKPPPRAATRARSPLRHEWWHPASRTDASVAHQIRARSCDHV